MDYLEQEKEQIIEKLLSENKVKPGQSIDYTYFLELYEPYRDGMSEQDFAGILGISNASYTHIKNKETRARVLKDRLVKLSEEKKKEIIEQLISRNKIKPGQLIDYEEFLKLYESYKELMSEHDFAEILGISYGNYNNIKKRNKGKSIKR